MPPKPGSPDYRYLKTATEVFGEKQGEPINSGFVFEDGTYVDAPYVISRRGVDIYVNDVKAATPVRWPPMDYDDKKPEMPKGLTKNSTFEDLEDRNMPGESLDRKMVRWLLRHHDEDEAKKLIIEYYKSLPFVKDVKPATDVVDARNTVSISTWDGKGNRFMAIGGYVYRPSTPEHSLKTLEKVCARMEDRLKKGECIFLFSDSGELAFGSRKAAMDLPAIVRTLRSDKPKDQKIKELQNLTLLPPSFPEKWEVLVTGFSASSQLDERVKQLRLPPGDTGERGPTVEEERALMEKIIKDKAAKERESSK